MNRLKGHWAIIFGTGESPKWRCIHCFNFTCSTIIAAMKHEAFVHSINNGFSNEQQSTDVAEAFNLMAEHNERR